MDLTNADVQDILHLLDGLPFSELSLETARFRLSLRRGADGWRLDAAYAVPDQFWAKVLPRVRDIRRVSIFRFT